MRKEEHIHLECSDLHNYRVPRERIILFISVGCLVLAFFVLLKISYIVVLMVIAISVALVKIRQGQLLGQSVKVSADQFPEVYAAAETAATRLSMKLPDVFIKYSPFINAFALGFFGKKSVVLHSRTVKFMENDELISILGHEFTHVRCHHTNWIVITNSSEGLRIPILSDIMSLFFRAWSRKAEFTADRGGLLASRSLGASFSSLLKITLGEERYEGFCNHLDNKIDELINETSETSKIPETIRILLEKNVHKRWPALEGYYDSGEYEQLVEQSKNQKEMENDTKKLKEEINRLTERRGTQQN